MNPFTLMSTSFDHGSPIPPRHTCDAEDVSPCLSWTGVPEGTRSLALIVDDPDAPDPDAPRMKWVHWVLYNLPVSSTGLPEAVDADSLPTGTLEGKNDWKRDGYGGPCPPIGRHRYFFRIHALDIELPNLDHPTRRRLEEGMQGHVLEEAVLMGTYSHDDARTQR
jgi:Raf kinase inhibitor-like YbhB/YbcL family protein